MKTRSHLAIGPESGADEYGSNRPARRISMHEGIAVWCDCCSCAAEPYWLEVAEELGIDLGSDSEDEDAAPSPEASDKRDPDT